MANGPAFAEAAHLATTAPGLSIGCHVVLIDGDAVLPPERIPTLTARNSATSHSVTPNFRDGLKTFAVRALAGRINPEEIEAEACAQIRKIQSTGISISHIDSHKHTHLFPAVLRPLLKAASACGIRAVRNPFGPRFPFKSTQLLARPTLWTRVLEVGVLRRFASKFRDGVANEGFSTPDGTLGIEVTGSLDDTLFDAIAQSIPEGTWEFVCHPGYNDADLQGAKTRLRESREIELQVLTSPHARKMLSAQGIELISYHDLNSSS
jgi:predicted glycoside hydrolase/deacetylase ChbG (UPF0249 family)